MFKDVDFVYTARKISLMYPYCIYHRLSAITDLQDLVIMLSIERDYYKYYILLQQISVTLGSERPLETV